MTNRTSIGGGNNEASNPKDWSPTGAPQAGDTLVMNGETNNPINVSDYNLRGNSLNVQGGAIPSTCPMPQAPLSRFRRSGPTTILRYVYKRFLA